MLPLPPSHQAVLPPPMCPMCGPCPRPHSPQHPGDQGLAPAALSACITSRCSPLQAIIRAVLSFCAHISNNIMSSWTTHTPTHRPVTPTTHLVFGLLVGARCQQSLHHLEATHTAGRNEGRETDLFTGSAILSSDSHAYGTLPLLLP